MDQIEMTMKAGLVRRAFEQEAKRLKGQFPSEGALLSTDVIFSRVGRESDETLARLYDLIRANPTRDDALASLKEGNSH